MSKKYDISDIYGRAMKLLDENQEIVYESILIDCLGVSHDWFYKKVMSNNEYSETIKVKVFENRGKETLQAIRDMKRSESPACIISRAKMMNKDIRDALDNKEMQSNENRQIVVNIGDQSNVIDLDNQNNNTEDNCGSN